MTPMTSSGLSFDLISIIAGDKAGQSFSPSEFMKLPVTDRVKMVLGKQITFSLNGQEVDKRSPLNELRKWTAEQES